MADWYSGSGQKTNIQDIYTSLKLHTKSNNKIFIGTDSFVSREKVCFASAICLHGESVAKYFFIKEYDEPKKYVALVSRITEEVRRSVEIAENIIHECDISANKVELHIDASPFDMRKTGTARFSEMLKGYVNGAGFACKTKPDAWASQTVADRHSK
jgi:predicted RNase H-related nuclease YkuK (DUF458 family)